MDNPKCPSCSTVNYAGAPVCRRCGGALPSTSSRHRVPAAVSRKRPRTGFLVFGGMSVLFALTIVLFPSMYEQTPERGRVVVLLLTLIVSVFVQLYGRWPVAGVLTLLGGLLIWIAYAFPTVREDEPS